MYRLIPFILLFVLITCSRENNQNVLIRLAHPMSPGNNVTLGYEKFAELVDKKSGGKIKVELYPNAVIGNDKVGILAVRNGEIEMASSSTPNLSDIIPEYMIFDIPYITDIKNQHKLYEEIDNGKLGKYFDKLCVNNYGMKPIMWSEYGYRNFVARNRNIYFPEDMAGLKIRTTQSPIEIEVIKLLKATPVSLVWKDTYSSLISGEIDGEGNTFDLLYNAKHHEKLKYAVITRHNYSMHVLMINNHFWESLSPERKNIITESAKEALAYERRISMENEEYAKQQFIKSGIIVNELSVEQIQYWKNFLKPIKDRYKEKLPSKLFEIIEMTQN